MRTIWKLLRQTGAGYCRPFSVRPVLLALSLGLAGTAAMAAPLPDFATVRAQTRSSETLLLDRHGVVIHRLRTDFRVRRGAWLGLSDVSPVLVQMLLLSEDRRFFEHGGVDWWAVPAAAWSNLWHERVRGASTLSMQLAALLDPSLQRRGGARSFIQKMHHARAARALEAGWSKDQILEAWLNLVPFRGELVGVDALARTLFGKTAAGLDAQESALAAALVRAPNSAPARVAARACEVLQAWEAERFSALRAQGRDAADEVPGPLARSLLAADARAFAVQPAGAPDQTAGASIAPVTPCLSLQVLAGMTLHRHDWSAGEGLAPHLAVRLVREDPQGAARGQIASTLDAWLQALAIQSLQTQLRELRLRQVEDGAVVVLDNASGDILAWVGSSGALSQAADVDGVTARRQPGSTLKPFLYGQALAERRLTAASLLDDSPAQLSTASGLYIPQNHDHHYRGWVSVRTALGSSLNLPAVRTLVMVTPDAFHAQLQRLGLTFPESGGYYGYSLALGSAEVNLLQLTNAFRALANGGRWCPVQARKPASPDVPAGPLSVSGHHAGVSSVNASATAGHDRRAIARQTACHQALDAGAAFIVADMLSDRYARIPSFGTDSILNTPFWSAVKTGTSKDMRDNWAIGFTRHYTVGVWVGNASGAPMHDVVGTSGAAPVWATLMRELHRQQPGLPPRAPAGLARQRVHFRAPLKGLQRMETGRMGARKQTAEAGAPEAMGSADTVEPPRMEWFLAGTEPVRAEEADASFQMPVRPVRDGGVRDFRGQATREGHVHGADGKRAKADDASAPVHADKYAGKNRRPTDADRRPPADRGDAVPPARILMPSEGTIIALDPDIPPAHQRVWLQAGMPADPDAAGEPAHSRARLRWTLDGKPIGAGARLSWFPLPGRHTLRLVDDAGRVLDVRHIEVRGAWLAPAAPGALGDQR